MQEGKEESEDLTYNQIAARMSGGTRAKILDLFDGKVTHVGALARKLSRERSTIKYHIEQCLDYSLIEEVDAGESDKRPYTLTPKGEKVLSRLSVPDTKQIRRNYYGGENL
jgi:predicted transcriptional regulator